MKISIFNDKSDVKEVLNYFGEDIGYGKYKKNAVDLLKNIIMILNEYSIDYFLISGTLLGYVRHNDIIPWDDDIDLIVSSKFLELEEDIQKKYNSFVFFNLYPDLIKFHDVNYIKKAKREKFGWPFVDMFIFFENEIENNIIFFKKKWKKNKFYPKKIINFVGIQNVVIPNDPDYFLKKNYGDNYNSVLTSKKFDHKEEKNVWTRATIDIISYKILESQLIGKNNENNNENNNKNNDEKI